MQCAERPGPLVNWYSRLGYYCLVGSRRDRLEEWRECKLGPLLVEREATRCMVGPLEKGRDRQANELSRSGGRFRNAAVLVWATQGRVVGLNFHLAQAGQADQ